MKPLSLRTTLTLSYSFILTLLLAVFGVAYFRTLSTQLDADASADLEELTDGLHGYLKFGDGPPQLVYDHNDPDEAAFIERATRYFQIYDATDGQLLLQSPALAPLGVEYTPAEVRAFRDQEQTDEVLTDRGRLRFSNSVITPSPGHVYLLQVGVRLAAMDNALQHFLDLLLWGVPASVIVAVVVGRWMAGRALAPLARLAAATRAFDVTDLTKRLPIRGAGDELDDVARAFNGTLDRLEHSIGEMRQFSTALAHELRTPLAALRGETELALLQADSPEEYRKSLTSQLEELDRLARLISQLLTLARAEAGEIPLARDPVDLSAVAGAVVQSLEPVAQARDITMSAEIAPDVQVRGDAGWLERLLLNLLDNAIKFTGPGGTIVVTVRRANLHAVLQVRDSGIGIARESLPHVFDRFYQGDPSRSSQGAGGIGLGLSLVKWIAERHGAAIDAESDPGIGTVFTATFPAMPR